jgi:hypothetical protein
MEEGEAAPIGQQAAPQVIPAVDLVHGLVVDDLPSSCAGERQLTWRISRKPGLNQLDSRCSRSASSARHSGRGQPIEQRAAQPVSAPCRPARG